MAGENQAAKLGGPRGSQRSPFVALASLTLAALAPRLVGLTWGLPDSTHFFSYHPDEFSTAGTVMGMLNTGDLNPRFFHYGSLSIYLTLLLAWPGHALGWVQTVVETHFVGRLVTVGLGTATVPLLYLLGRRLFDSRVAFLAALALAWMPGHVLHSQFATVDVPATFFVTAALLFAVRALSESGTQGLVLAGAAAGLAAATKYNAGLVLLAPLVAVWLRGSDRAANLLRTAAAALLVFLLAMPFAVLDFATFWDDLAYELFEHPREGHLNIFEQTGNGWIYHVRANLPYLAGVPLLLIAGAGLVTFARHRPVPWFPVLAFTIAYFLSLGLSQVRFLRYVIPLAPALALFAALGLHEAGRRSALLARVSTLVLLGALLALTASQQLALTRPDPRDEVARTVAGAVPPGTTIGLLNVPWFYTPPLIPWNGGPESRHRFEALVEQGAAPYRFRVHEDWDLDALRSAPPEVFLVSEFEWREEVRLGDSRARAFLEELERRYRSAGEFERFPIGSRWIFGGFAPHDWLYPFATVVVYERLAAR